MTAPRVVVIALPARDEARAIRRCLTSLSATVRHAFRHRLIDDAVVVVGAHRCTDGTAEVARRGLSGFRLPGAVLVDDDATTVGQVRDRAVRTGLALLGGDGAWVLSTDADTVVGVDWIARILAVAERCSADSVVGLATLDEWRGRPEGLRAYTEVLEEKLHLRSFGDEHDHVYGANLAVDAHAYLAVGGFPDTPLGEDQQLVDRLSAAGCRIARTCHVSVTTSGRTVGRADGGLADLLRRLGSDQSGGLPETVATSCTAAR